MEFRFLTAAEAPRLRNVPSDLFAGCLDMGWLENYLADPQHYLCVVFVEGIAIGFASGVYLTHPDKPAEFQISEISVTAAWRDASVADALLEQLLAKARELNCNLAWSLSDADDAGTNAFYRQRKGVVSHAVVQHSFLLDELVEALPPLGGVVQYLKSPPIPHPAPDKPLNFLLDLHLAEKSGYPPGQKLAQQIASEFLPDDEMEVQLENWRNVGWSWKFAIGERSYEGVFAVLINPQQALLQMGAIDASNFFGSKSEPTLEELEPLRERTERCLAKLADIAKFQYSAAGFQDQYVPNPNEASRSAKQRKDAQQTGLWAPVGKNVNLLYRPLLSLLRPEPESEPVRRIDVFCMHGLVILVLLIKAGADLYLPWRDHLWLVPLLAIFIGCMLAYFRKQAAWITVTLLTFGVVYIIRFFLIVLFSLP